jgi:hypothetical protein
MKYIDTTSGEYASYFLWDDGVIDLTTTESGKERYVKLAVQQKRRHTLQCQREPRPRLKLLCGATSRNRMERG